MSDGFSTTVRFQINARDEGLCVVCWMVGGEIHHRRRRRENWDGLAHSAANGIRVCGWGNTGGCHGRIHRDPEWAATRGYRVAPSESPLTVPMLHAGLGWVLLGEDGTWTRTEVQDGKEEDPEAKPEDSGTV